MKTFAQKYPFYMKPETARELLAISQCNRLMRSLQRATREAGEAAKRMGHGDQWTTTEIASFYGSDVLRVSHGR